jgi:hypothetical protein
MTIGGQSRSTNAFIPFPRAGRASGVRFDPRGCVSAHRNLSRRHLVVDDGIDRVVARHREIMLEERLLRDDASIGPPCARPAGSPASCGFPPPAASEDGDATPPRGYSGTPTMLRCRLS